MPAFSAARHAPLSPLFPFSCSRFWSLKTVGDSQESVAGEAHRGPPRGRHPPGAPSTHGMALPPCRPPTSPGPRAPPTTTHTCHRSDFNRASATSSTSVSVQKKSCLWRIRQTRVFNRLHVPQTLFAASVARVCFAAATTLRSALQSVGFQSRCTEPWSVRCAQMYPATARDFGRSSTRQPHRPARGVWR